MANSNLHNAAVLLSSLPKTQAARLLGLLEPGQVAVVTAEMGRIEQIDAVEQENVARDFAKAGAACAANRRQADVAPFQFLYDVPGDDLLELIGGERPQTMALVVSYLPPRQAADVLAELPADEQLEVFRRIAAMRQPSDEVIADVEQELRDRLCPSAAGPAGNRGILNLVKILHAMPPATERRLLGELGEADPGLLREIRHAMFGADVAERLRRARPKRRAEASLARPCGKRGQAPWRQRFSEAASVCATEPVLIFRTLQVAAARSPNLVQVLDLVERQERKPAAVIHHDACYRAVVQGERRQRLGQIEQTPKRDAQ